MITDRKIHQSAHVLFQEHGDDAPVVAATKASELDEAGDSEGAQVWRRILQALNEIQNTEPEGPLN